MKITIEAEIDSETKQYPEPIIINNVFEFGMCLRYIKNNLYEDSKSFLHVNEKEILEGRLFELIARLRNGSTTRQ